MPHVRADLSVKLSRTRPPKAELVAPVTGAELVDSFLETLGADTSRRTMLDGLTRCARLLRCPTAREVPWHELDLDTLARMKRALLSRKGLAYSTMRLSLAAVRGVLRQAKSRRLIDGFHFEEASLLLRKVRGSNLPRGRALTDEEVGKLLDACELDRHPRGAMLRAVLLLALGTGLRRSELCRLSVDCFDGRAIRVVSKGSHEVACFLTPTTRKALDAWLDVRQGLRWSHRRLFGSPVRGAVLQPWSLWALFSGRRGDGGLCALAEVRRFSPHDLRRSFATRMFRGGLGTSTIQKLMNHKHQETTTRYDRRGDDELEVERLKVADYES
jgi:integrase